ncbi:MAG: calcium/sodium antiporter [Micavibrio sp.]|nr:MAG: calcium/sodium antiporter [Micavibrio sp.]
MLEFTTIEGLVLAVGAMITGIILLMKGGDWTIESAVFVAKRWGVSPLVVGFTIIAFGTSLPELIVSVLANIQGSPGIAIGNVLGSNIANILLVIGSAAIFTTLAAGSKGMTRDLVMMMASTVLLLFLLQQGEVGRLAGLAMLLALVMYVLWQYRAAGKGDEPPPDTEDPAFKSQLVAYGFLFAGLICIALGAEFLVRGAKVSAHVIGVPEAVIALSIIAFGTSLPELSTSIIASRKGHSDIVLGNIIGSNVFNILMIIGVTALVKPIQQGSFAPQLAQFDIWLVLAVSLIFALLLVFYKKINRPIGLAFCGGYIAYNIYIYAIYMGS